jgi:hypothetical protein
MTTTPRRKADSDLVTVDWIIDPLQQRCEFHRLVEWWLAEPLPNAYDLLQELVRSM